MGINAAHLDKLVASIGADRALIAQYVDGHFVASARIGFDDSPIDDLPISLSMLRQVQMEGAPLLMMDASKDAKFRDRLSVLISDIRSVVCVPFWNDQSRVAGVIYADCRSENAVFTRRELDAAHHLAREIERDLFGKQRVEAPAPPTQFVRPKPYVPKPRPVIKAAAVPEALARARPNGKAVIIFYRCLATMVGAGLTLSRAMAVLSEHSEDKVLASVCAVIEERLVVGSSLSSALALFPRAFSDGNVKLVRVGETGGSLAFILERVAHHEEKMQASQGKLLSSLTYPAIVLSLTLLMLLVVPPFVLEGQFKLIRESGVDPPLPTRILMTASTALGHPVTWIALVAIVVGSLWGARQAWQNPVMRRIIYERTAAARVIGPLLRLLTTTRFTQSVALMHEVGIPLTDALPLAAGTSLNPLLEHDIGRAVAHLQSGETLAESLEMLGLLSGAAIESIRAGEATGGLDKMLLWCSRIAEEELDLAMDSYTALIEPILMLVMGVVVGGMLMATLLPMVTLLQTL